jgi:hypothetical protein
VEYCYRFLGKKQVVSFLTGTLSIEDYYRREIPEFDMIEYINQKVDGSAFTYLLLTGNKYALYEKPIKSGGYFSEGPLISDIRRSANGDELAQLLAQRGIGHLMLHAERLKKVFSDRLEGEEKQVWNQFQMNYLVPVHQAAGFSLWKLKSVEGGVPVVPQVVSESNQEEKKALATPAATKSKAPSRPATDEAAEAAEAAKKEAESEPVPPKPVEPKPVEPKPVESEPVPLEEQYP